MSPQQSPTWEWSSLRSDYRRTGPLRLQWEPDGSAMSDDYTPEEADALDLWQRWAPKVAEHGGLVPILWVVEGDTTFEFAPFQVLPKAWTGERDFLTYFTWPTAVDTGKRLNWLTLPVADKGWRPGKADKGGFVSEALGGWKPSPLQPTMPVEALARAAGIGGP